MKLNKRWILGILAGVLVAGGGYFVINQTPISAQQSGLAPSAAVADAGADQTAIAIRPADSSVAEVSAAGYIELEDEQIVALDVSGGVSEIAVSTGDAVQAGDLLLSLESADLQRAVQRAELSVETAQNALDQLLEEADAADVAVAEADLKEAQENLADVLDGPSEDEIAAARSNLSSAWSKVGELEAGPSDAELTQLSADLKKKEVALDEARRDYEEIAWRNDVGMTAEASAFQQATIDYESAVAAYEEAVAPADASELQSALSSAQNAQVTLDELLDSPTEAEIATAEARVADAEAALDDLLRGADATDLRDAEIALEQALLDLEEAYADLADSRLTAPIDGTVLAINADVGERLNEGAAVITLADTERLELTIDVAEVDIVQVQEGQAAAVEIDALSGQRFDGEVAYIAPASEASAGVVNYAVTIRLIDDTPAGVRPGMTAVATIENTTAEAANSWYVPTTAIVTEGKTASVVVTDGEAQRSVPVIPGAVQGEWTVVQSAELQAGERVMGAVASYVDEGEEAGGFGPPGDGAGFGPPGS